MLKSYAEKVKQQFMQETTPPPPPPAIVPISQADIDRAIAQGWEFTEDGDRWEAKKDTRLVSNPKNEDVTNFNNNLNVD